MNWKKLSFHCYQQLLRFGSEIEWINDYSLFSRSQHLIPTTWTLPIHEQWIGDKVCEMLEICLSSTRDNPTNKLWNHIFPSTTVEKWYEHLKICFLPFLCLTLHISQEGKKIVLIRKKTWSISKQRDRVENSQGSGGWGGNQG